MYAKTLLVSTLLASAALVSAAPVPQSKRCIGACGTTNNNTTNNNESTQTTNTENVNTSTTQKDNGNSAQTGNSGGGNSFGNASVGKVCRRAFVEARGINHAQHMYLVARNAPAKPAAKHAAAPHPAGKPPGLNLNTNKWTTNSATTNNVNSNNKSTSINNTKTNNANFSNNSGQISGSGVVCRRELEEADMERRELDTGASVLAALGGQSVARSLDEPSNLLATRDLGRLADVLGVRAAGHDIDDATHYKRSVGLECATDSCDALARREAEELLMVHARDLGFFVEDME